MRKKKLFVLFIAIISILSMSVLQANAGSAVTIKDIDYYHDEKISPEKAEQIVKAMFSITDDTPTVQPYNIFCLLGHSIHTGTVITVEHRVWADTPRCREKSSDVELCIRGSCPYYKVIDERTLRIVCCPRGVEVR